MDRRRRWHGCCQAVGPAHLSSGTGIWEQRPKAWRPDGKARGPAQPVNTTQCVHHAKQTTQQEKSKSQSIYQRPSTVGRTVWTFSIVFPRPCNVKFKLHTLICGHQTVCQLLILPNKDIFKKLNYASYTLFCFKKPEKVMSWWSHIKLHEKLNIFAFQQSKNPSISTETLLQIIL